MAQTLTNRVEAIKNDNDENILIAEINSAFDKFDNHFIPACKIRNTNQSIPHNVTTNVQFSATTVDSYSARDEGDMADLANDRILIRKTGLYLITFNNLWLSGSAPGLLRSDIVKNGTSVNAVFDPGTAAALSQKVEHSELLTAGDIITARVFQTSGVARSIDHNTYDNVLELSAVWQGSVVEV